MGLPYAAVTVILMKTGYGWLPSLLWLAMAGWLWLAAWTVLRNLSTGNWLCLLYMAEAVAGWSGGPSLDEDEETFLQYMAVALYKLSVVSLKVAAGSLRLDMKFEKPANWSLHSEA